MKLVMTAFERPNYFEEALKSWAAARGVHRLDVAVALEPSNYVNEMSYLAESILSASVRLNPTRLGVLENPYQALERSFEGMDQDCFTILAEDDTIVSTDIVEYFEWASRRFFPDPQVLGVCAFSWEPPVQSARRVALKSKFCPIVWGTWKNRWESTLGPTWDHDYSTGVPIPHHQSGWDWNINLRVMGARTFVWPEQSRSDHIGKFGGTHMNPNDFDASRAPSFRPEVGVQDYALTQ